MKKNLLCFIALLVMSAGAYAQTITGHVKSAQDKSPLPGVSVILKGTTTGTTTNADGEFVLPIAGNNDPILLFSFIGLKSSEVAVGTKTVVDIEMEEDFSTLGEVVVTAFGIQREEKALGYSTVKVSSDQITQAGNTNFASSLYGKVAGLKITTAPGGASSAVNVQIRGINSLNNNQQPLYVVDGVIIRNDQQNGTTGANNNNYWDDQRIRGNGILDINPSDIESLSVLKGASASALYGSDGSSGVIVITTKKGTKAKGLGVDLNYSGTIEQVAFLPKFQNVYGPGYDRASNTANGANAEGWIADASSPTGSRPYFRAYGQFGPKMEGQQVKWWDGSVHSFSARKDNYRDIFDVGHNSNWNIGISNQNEKISFRLSATNMDYKGTSPGSTQKRNTFHLNSTIKLNEKLSADVVVSYMNTKTHNRAYQLGQVLGSFGGFFSRTEDMSIMRNRFQTTDGYKYSTLGTGRPEDFVYNIRATNLLDFFWNQLRNSYDETENRMINSATLNWDVVNHFKLRGRIGNDVTSVSIDDKRYNENATAYNQSSQSTGMYATSKGLYSILYGDVLATYSNKFADDFDFSISAGYTARSEKFRDQNTSTTNGLVTENWFSISNSYGIVSSAATRSELLKYGYFGIGNLSYKNFAFIEATLRKEYSSTLPAINNSYAYPSVNGSFVFTDAFQLPDFLTFGKIRASYGVVGNSPGIYSSNILYTQQSLQTINGSVPSLNLNGPYGNNNIKPEMKHENEYGVEVRFLNNKLGLDVTYFNNKVKDQIISLTTPPSTGASGQVVNIGEIGSKGLEIGLNATPINGNIKWETRLTFTTNKTTVNALAPGVDQIVFYDAEQSAVKVVGRTGERLGNIYVNPRATDANGKFIISDDGYYVIDKTRYVKAGNIMPKATGGMSNTISYKNFVFGFTVDYRFGGQMVSPPTKYQMGAGLYENTLAFRDAAHGGLDISDGGETYHDGVLLQGVNQNTGLANTKVISAADYYLTTFGWGSDSWNEKGSVFDNSYIKFREASLGYNVPTAIANKVHLNKIRVSFVGRNLFYIWRTLENLDPEAPLGNKWWSQGVDVGSSAATRSYGFSLNTSF